MSYFKNYTCAFMQANSWHKLFHFHLTFWIWKMWKQKGKTTKNWISRERKELFRWNKKHFSQFLKGYHLVKKNKNLIKNSTHKLLTLNEQRSFLVIISWVILMFDKIFVSPQVKPIVIISNKHGIYELPNELPNDLRFRTLGN